jgi:hypothetical protein
MCSLTRTILGMFPFAIYYTLCGWTPVARESPQGPQDGPSLEIFPFLSTLVRTFLNVYKTSSVGF